LVLEDPRFPAFVGFATFFDVGRLMLPLCAGRALCAAGLFAELFFFFVGFAIALKAPSNRVAPEKRTLN
jgi:hypothetical protein